MKSRVNSVMENNRESQFTNVLVAIIAIIVTLVLFALWRSKRSKGRSVLLTGLSDAGKTLLYARLLHSKYVKTHTSVKENMGHIIINNNSLQIIDIPGHKRLRYKFVDKYKSSARGLIYVIDSVTFQKDIRDVAEFLYTLLSDTVILKNISILILCNKQDQTMAKGSGVVKTLLEKELNLLRVTKMNQLESTDASSTNIFLGKVGKEFEFADLGSKVEFGESSATGKDTEMSADFAQLNIWLSKLV